MEPEAMFPLYPPSGSPVQGYVCNCCREGNRTVTRTKRGMWSHLRIVHGIKKQEEFVFEGEKDERAESARL